MKNETYLYSAVYDFTVQPVLAEINGFGDEDFSLRLKTFGGDPLAAWGLCAKVQEAKGKSLLQIDGACMSSGSLLIPFFDESEALDVSKIMIHRGDMYVTSAEDQAYLDSINKDMRAKLEKRIDAKALKDLKGVTIKEIFESEERIELMLTGAEAKKIGLIDRVVKLNPIELNALNEKYATLAAKYKPSATKAAEEKPNHEPQKNKPMTIEELKASHSEVYKAIRAAGFKAGIKKERERVEAFLVYSEIDAKAVRKAIEDGEELTPKAMAEFSLKVGADKELDKVAAAAAKGVATEGEDLIVAKTKADKDLAVFAENVNRILKVKAVKVPEAAAEKPKEVVA